MRRSISILVAAAMVAASAVIAPAGAAAAPMAPPTSAKAPTGVTNAQFYFGFGIDGRRHHHDRRAYSYYHRRHHQPAPFFFGFPFGVAPYYYHQHRQYYRDCFRGRDGRVYCRRY
jgi:hypothetical protein